MYIIPFLLSIFALCNAVNVKSSCPSEWFNGEFVSLADVVVPESLLDFESDNFTFFQEVMRFSEEEIEATTQAAINFFKSKFGLDFSQTQPDELGQRISGSATFIPFTFSPQIRYTITHSRWIVSGIQRSQCFVNRDGGFMVTFSEQQTLFGTYGGQEGKPISPGEVVLYGFYNIPVCAQEPIVIRYNSDTPFRFEAVDGFAVINCELYHHVLGEGRAQGVLRSVPLSDQPGMIHITIRNLFTFPANPGLTVN